MLYRHISRHPFSKCSGGIEGRPIREYIWSKTGDNRRSSASASTLIADRMASGHHQIGTNQRKTQLLL